MKTIVFLLIMALITLIPVAMRHHTIGPYLAPLKPFVYGEPALCGAPAAKTPGDIATQEYANTWWDFNLSYPADWVEWDPLKPAQVLSVGPSGEAPYPRLTVTVMPLYLYSLEQSPKVLASLLRKKATILREKSSRLKDGAPAREAELTWPEDGKQVNTVMLATLRGHTLIVAHLSHTSGPPDEMRRILYSLSSHLSRSGQAG